MCWSPLSVQLQHVCDNGFAVQELREQLCSALCALSEQILQNAAEVSAVSTEVSQLLERAQQVQEKSPEPLQALASLRSVAGS